MRAAQAVRSSGCAVRTGPANIRGTRGRERGILDVTAHWYGSAPAGLLEALRSLRDLEKYDSDALDQVERLFIARNHAPYLRRLAHFSGTLERYHPDGAPTPLLAGGDLATTAHLANAFRGHLPDRDDASGTRFHNGGLVCVYPDDEFTVWWKDALVLPPLFELLYLGLPRPRGDGDPAGPPGRKDKLYNPIRQGLDRLADPDVTLATVNAVAADWENETYRWLGDFGDEEARERFKKDTLSVYKGLVKRLRARSGEPDPSRSGDWTLLDAVDDDGVLELWLEQAQPGGDSELHHFATLAHRIESLVEAALAGREVLAGLRAASLGDDPEAGQVSEERLAEALDLGLAALDAADVNPLATLRSPPLGAVKFLKDREFKEIGPLVERIALRRRLPVTRYRRIEFGPIQRKLSRSKDRDERSDLLRSAAVVEPEHLLEAAAGLRRRIALVRDAVLHVLHSLSAPYAVARLREQSPELACWEALGEGYAASTGYRDQADGSDGEQADLAGLAAYFFEQLGEWRKKEPALDAQLDRLRNAWRRINTQGFDRLPENGMRIDGLPVEQVFEQGDRALAALEQSLARLPKELLQEDRGAARERIRSGDSLLVDRLRSIYGVPES
jgi:hypothetical protein